MAFSRRKSVAALFAGAILSISLQTAANEPSVPLKLQVDLTTKLIPFAREPPVLSADIIRIGILAKSGSAESTHFAIELKGALDSVETIAGLRHEQSIMAWIGPEALVADSKLKKLLVIYLTPGLIAEMPSIAAALEGVPIITIAATDSYVANGAILGFDLVSGHPKMLFNLRQAQKQNVVFQSAVMKLMRIVE
jgi:YfiR/HmsC-like